MDNTPKTKANFDPLDMNNYRIEKLPKMQKSGFERFLQRIGAPLAILAFVMLYWVVDIPFINRIDTNPQTTQLTQSAQDRYQQIQTKLEKQAQQKQQADEAPMNPESIEQATHQKFIRINYAMLAIFIAAIILWITEAIPNLLITSSLSSSETA